MKRRTFLTGVGGVAAAGLTAHLARSRDESSLRASVFIAKAASYDLNLEPIVRAGLHELGLGPLWVRGRTILLKPNLVEPCGDAPQINTHPALVRATAEVFRGWGAGDVFLAEGPGHCRDSQLVLDQSGLRTVLK